MANNGQATSQEKLHTFFREIVLGEPGVDRALADRVAERCVKHIDLLLDWDRGRQEKKPAAAFERPRVPPLRASHPIQPASLRPFDPYAFSVVVTLVKKGRDALIQRLSEIENVEHLRQLASAQHLGIDPGLAQPEEVRLAIVSGAERRLASRRAAAS